MKINIIGLPASGKTTLATRLLTDYSLPCLNLDLHVFKTVGKHHRIRISSDVYLGTVKKFMKKRHWVIEGIYPIDEVMQKADIIIVMHRSFPKLLYLQWLRYCTDPIQREEYGFISNLKLSQFIYNLYFNKIGITVYDSIEPLLNKDIEKKLRKYKKKVKKVTSKKDIEHIIAHIEKKLRA